MKKLMKTTRILSFVLMLLIQASAVTVFAQSKPKAGDIITGVVKDSDGPLSGVILSELRWNNQIEEVVARAVTNDKGEFSFQIVDLNDEFFLSCKGYETIIITPDKFQFDITMKKDTWGTELVPAYFALFEFIACKEAYGHGHYGCIPKDFICGYFFKPYPYTINPYGIFLTKDSDGYMLVLNRIQSDTLRIDSEQALRMAQSVKDTIDNAVTEQYRTLDITGNPPQLYAIMPGRMAERWTDVIPDPEWNEMLQRLDRKLQVAETTASALNKPKTGDVITGIVSDNEGPMMMVNVTERDQNDRIVAHTITDKEGKFSFQLVNPMDRLMITYVGYETVDIPFAKLNFDIKMKERIGKLIGTKEVYPRDRGLLGTKTDFMEKLKQYAPDGFVCGYIMRNAWNKNLWGIFLVKEGRKYSLVYKEADKTKTRSIKSNLVKDLEASVNKKIADIEYAVSNPVIVEVYDDGLPIVDILYDGDIAFAITPDKAAHFWAWGMKDYLGINDDIWQQEIDKFKQTEN